MPGEADPSTVRYVSTERQRTYSWNDPAPIAEANRSLSGLEFVRGLVDGTVPHHPTASTLGFRVTDAREGFVEITAEPQEWHYNAVGSVHGGVIATMIDTAMGFSVSSTLPAGVGYTTLDITVRYIRGIKGDGGSIRVHGFSEHTGRTTATARAEVRDDRDRLLATASTTCLILP